MERRFVVTLGALGRLLFAYIGTLLFAVVAAKGQSTRVAVPVWQGTTSIGGQPYFALATLNGSHIENRLWVGLDDRRSDWTPVRYDSQLAVLFVQGDGHDVYTLHRADQKVNGALLPPLPRNLAIRKLDELIGRVEREKHVLKYQLAIDFSVEAHVSPEQFALIAARKGFVESRGRQFIAAWSDEQGIEEMEFPAKSDLFERFLVAQLTPSEVECYSALWKIALVELTITKAYNYRLSQ